MKFGELITSLANDAKVDLTDEEYKPFLAMAASYNEEIPDKLAAGIKNGLMTEDAAKNNSKVKDYFFGKFATHGDSILLKTLAQYDLPETDKAEVSKGDGVYNRFAILAAKVKELEAKKGGAKTGDKKELEDQIAALNKQLLDTKTEMASKLESVSGEKDKFWGEKLKNNELSRFFGDFEYGLDLPKEIMIGMGKQLLDRDLAAKGLVLIYDPEKPGDLGLTKQDGTIPYDQNKPVTVKEIATRLLAENKLLKVSGAAPAAPNKPAGAQPQPHVVSTGNAGAMDTSAYMNAVNTALADRTN